MSDHDFNTPPEVLADCRKMDRNGVIGLDPCSNQYSMVHAKTAYTVVENGLIQPWRGHGLVFLNPPHSTKPNNIEPWIHRVREEFIQKPIERENNPTRDQLIGLVPAKTGPQWFHSLIPHCGSRCFIYGRIKYWQRGAVTPGPGKFDSMLFYIGPSPGRFAFLFKSWGWTV